jgi:hypothetical protein
MDTDAAAGGARHLAGAAALALEIAVHAALVPDHLAEMPYVGVLFALSVVLLVPSLVVLVVRPGAAAWLAGAALCAGLAVAFVVSRTVGLPGYHEAWTTDHSLGLVSLAGDAAYLAAVPWRSVRTAVAQVHRPERRHPHRRGRRPAVMADVRRLDSAEVADP